MVYREAKSQYHTALVGTPPQQYHINVYDAVLLTL